ncbi:MAG TPA: NUDIX hydrolase [Gammaproteobacteria bacterium]|nr:NUDIX hydrolase [Gammaproteobacteria bacterium]
MATKTPGEGQHRNDMYGDNIKARSEDDAGVSVPIPAATVVLMRQAASDATRVEVLMLRKNSKITFGGNWVFPGGKIDPADYPAGEVDTTQIDAAARTAAARETVEEAGLSVAADDFVQISHWTPPPGPQKRFATWFFIALTDTDDAVLIDDGEIKESAWIDPAQALAKHAAGEIDLVPPTWITLNELAQLGTAEATLAHYGSHEPKVYKTRVLQAAAGHRVALWEGDAGYAAWDADLPGARHRLIMSEGGFTFQKS